MTTVGSGETGQGRVKCEVGEVVTSPPVTMYRDDVVPTEVGKFPRNAPGTGVGGMPVPRT